LTPTLKVGEGNLQPTVAEMKLEIPHGEAGEGLERIYFDTDFWIQNNQTLSFSVFLGWRGWRGWRGCFSSYYREKIICFDEMPGQLNRRLQKHPLHPLHPLQGLP
jgi:hypothetical protein